MSVRDLIRRSEGGAADCPRLQCELGGKLRNCPTTSAWARREAMELPTASAVGGTISPEQNRFNGFGHSERSRGTANTTSTENRCRIAHGFGVSSEGIRGIARGFSVSWAESCGIAHGFSRGWDNKHKPKPFLTVSDVGGEAAEAAASYFLLSNPRPRSWGIPGSVFVQRRRDSRAGVNPENPSGRKSIVPRMRRISTRSLGAKAADLP